MQQENDHLTAAKSSIESDANNIFRSQTNIAPSALAHLDKSKYSHYLQE